MNRAAPDILFPISQRPLVVSDNGAAVYWETEPSRLARYALQSVSVTLSVSGIYSPPVERLRPDNTARIAYLRYRRRW